MQTLTTLFCLIGFVYQLGASPCGCLHENHWHQAILGICDADQSKHKSQQPIENHFDHSHHFHSHDSTQGKSGDDSVPGHENDHQHPHDSCPCDCSDLVYLNSAVNANVEMIRPNLGLAWQSFADAGYSADFQIIFADCLSATNKRQVLLRAQIGVFLL